MNRCIWANASQLEQDYHDREWGVPLHDDRLLFEFLVLEGAQAGLSWSTILKKRQGYRQAFDNFDLEKIATYGPEKIAELLANPAIIRNRLKINAAIDNAKAGLALIENYGSLNAYLWDFVDGETIQNRWQSHANIPVTTPQAEAMGKNLKKRGFKFVGPTICYAFMQATGMVNDHAVDCFRHSQLA